MSITILHEIEIVYKNKCTYIQQNYRGKQTAAAVYNTKQRSLTTQVFLFQVARARQITLSR